MNEIAVALLHNLIHEEALLAEAYVQQKECLFVPVTGEFAAFFALLDNLSGMTPVQWKDDLHINLNDFRDLESATNISNNVIALWQTGAYQPDPQYPFTLEE